MIKNREPRWHQYADLHSANAFESESRLLGSCLKDPSKIDHVCDIVVGANFLEKRYGDVFDRLVLLHGSGVNLYDPAVVSLELRKANLYDSLGGSAGYGKLVSDTPNSDHAIVFAKDVIRLSSFRRLVDALVDGLTQCDCPSPDAPAIASKIETELQLHSASTSVESFSVDEMIGIALADLDAIRSGLRVLGCPTGFSSIDSAIGGFQNSELTVLAARPGCGKTAFALNVAARNAEKGRKIAFLSLEMDERQLAHRLLSMETGIPTQRIRTGSVSDDERKNLTEAWETQRNWTIKALIPPTATMESIRAKARATAAQWGLDLLIIDHLGLIEPTDRKASPYDQASAKSKALKLLARELKKPVLCLCQLNRQAAKEVPGLHHLRDSGRIEEDSDNVWFLHRERDEHGDYLPAVDLLVRKLRQGDTGEFPFKFNGAQMRFTSV